MYRSLLFLAAILPGCAPQGAWQPTLSPAIGTELAVAEEHFSDGCSIQWTSLLVGLHSGALLDPRGIHSARIPASQVLELAGSGGIALAQVHIPSGTQQEAVEFQLGPPQDKEATPYQGPCPQGDCGDDGADATGSPALGNGTEDQRELLRDHELGGQISGILTCPDETDLFFSWSLPTGTIRCTLNEWTLEAASSVATWVELDFSQLFASSEVPPSDLPPLTGQPWVNADHNEDGLLSSEEIRQADTAELGLPGSTSMELWLQGLLSSLPALKDGTACSWSAWSTP